MVMSSTKALESYREATPTGEGGLRAVQPDLIEALANPSDTRAISRLNSTLKTIQQQANVGAIYVMDRNGLTIGASNWDQPLGFVGKNFSYRPYFDAALKGRAGRFYGIGSTTGEPGYYLAHGLTQGERERRGPPCPSPRRHHSHHARRADRPHRRPHELRQHRVGRGRRCSAGRDLPRRRRRHLAGLAHQPPGPARRRGRPA